MSKILNNKLSKKLATFVLCSLIMITGMAPTFASNHYPWLDVVDGGTITQTVTGTQVFFINVTDPETRAIQISSPGRVKATISSDLSDRIFFTSGDFNGNCLIGHNFLPGIEYKLTVTTESSSQTVNISMSKGAPASMVVMPSGLSAKISEQNLLSGGQSEYYNLGITTAGTYTVTVNYGGTALAIINDSLNSSNNKSLYLANGGLSFDMTFSKSDVYSGRYLLGMISTNPKNSGNSYEIRVERKY